MNKGRCFAGFLSTLLCLLIGPAAASDHQPDAEQHEAHEHGEAQLLIALDGHILEMELLSPAVNLVGFEHKPQNEEQRQRIDQSIALLKQPGELFAIDAAAQCTVVTTEVESELAGHAEEEASGETDEPGEHADFAVHHRLNCAQPDRLQTITVKLFQYFPATERIEAQIISPRGQYARELTPQSNSLDL